MKAKVMEGTFIVAMDYDYYVIDDPVKQTIYYSDDGFKVEKEKAKQMEFDEAMVHLIAIAEGSFFMKPLKLIPVTDDNGGV